MAYNLDIIGSKKILRIVKVVQGHRPGHIWLSEEFLNPVISKLELHVVI